MTTSPHSPTSERQTPAADMLNVYKVESPKQPGSNKLRAAKIIVLLLIISGVIIVSAAGGGYAYTKDRVLPNVSVAGIKLGGLDRLAATELLQQRFNTMIDGGVDVELYEDIQHIDLRTSVATDPDLVYQLLDWDVGASVEAALQVGRSGNQLRDFFSPLYHLTLKPVALEPNYVLAETRLTSAFRDAYPNAESTGTPTDFVVKETTQGLEITVTEAVEGAVLDTKYALESLKQDATDLNLQTLELRLMERSAAISKAQAETLIPDMEAALLSAPYQLVFDAEYGPDLVYPITAKDLEFWLLPGMNSDNAPALTLDTEAMETFLGDIHADIDISPQDAKFVIEGDRVVEFQESHDGFVINDDQLLSSLLASLGKDNQSIAIATERTAPSVPTGSANDLGIKEVLGVGFSSYAGSPSNRRANIRHGADKLNGLLIAPDETLSLLEKLRPFTTADGYFPELVIKGDQIIPEIGGGLCQIGTTTFRAALNSGLEIAERRNHSLVVSYYNDPSNGNPGTDATIYDPAPDLKIKNDTGNYIMLITTVNEQTSELFFTFWGTSDGRKGSYTPPEVLSWTGYGSTVEKETTSLAPGVRQCQAPHPGATTTFDYNIVMPDGTVKTQSFFSSYRSLPTICLVGIGSAGSTTTGTVQGISDEPI